MREPGRSLVHTKLQPARPSSALPNLPSASQLALEAWVAVGFSFFALYLGGMGLGSWHYGCAESLKLGYLSHAPGTFLFEFILSLAPAIRLLQPNETPSSGGSFAVRSCRWGVTASRGVTASPGSARSFLHASPLQGKGGRGVPGGISLAILSGNDNRNFKIKEESLAI